MASRAASPSGSLRRPSGSSRLIRWGTVFLCAALLVAASGYLLDRWRGQRAAEADPAALAPAFGPRDYPAALAALDSRVIGARDHLSRSPGEWLRMESLARALISRYRLAGNPGDLGEADALLGRAIAAAPDPSGPSLTRAGLFLLVHRLDDAEQSIARFERQAVPGTADERADALGMRGDIALQRGQTGEAERLYGAARAIADTPGIKLRSALLLARTGRLDEARALTDAALMIPRQQPAVLSDLALQRAGLAYASGDWSDAGRWINAAEKVFPGRWLTRAWAAQQLAIEGNPAKAIAAYTQLAQEAARPEVMDALAHLLRLQGQGVQSRAWAMRAAPLWQARVRAMPLAFAQHAAEHEIALGSPATALALARMDAQARPYGQSLVLLARAETLSGDPAAALQTLSRAEATGWHTALLELEKAAALEALGRGEDARAAQRDALARNPHVTDPATYYVWFGHE